VTNLPSVALSIRQPWCHDIIFKGKDVENRDWKPYNPGLRFRGPVLIHASKTVDAEDREEVKRHNMPLGGIVGVMEIVDVVTAMNSRWFFGPYGLVIKNARPLVFMPCKGALGFFRPEIDVSLLRYPEAA
jgi:hypothetical protein